MLHNKKNTVLHDAQRIIIIINNVFQFNGRLAYYNDAVVW